MDGAAATRFPEASARALGDEKLQAALRLLGEGFQARRTDAVNRFAAFEDAREAAVAAKTRTLRHLDRHLETFEARCREHGGVVHWAETPEDARQIVLELLTARGVRVLSKGKTMVAEEIGLNGFLEANGIEVIETDLGEYIVQLAEEAPSHIIAPAIHKTMPQVVELFRQHHDQAAAGSPPRHTPADLVAEARAVLRRRFLEADAGLTGANFLVAETGSSVIVTNEGNGDLTQTLPRLHIVLATIEKVVPTLADGAAVLQGAGPLRDRAGHVCLHDVVYRPPATGRCRRTGRVPRGPAGQRSFPSVGHAGRGGTALHPLRGLHESLPGVRCRGRACVRLGVSRADRRGADAGAAGR